VDDLGDRLAGLGVAFVVGELEVLDGEAVFVGPRGGLRKRWWVMAAA
jgi:hypothetical protein